MLMTSSFIPSIIPVVYPHITSCYHMIPYATTCYHMLLYVATYYHMLPHIITCYNMFPHVTTCQSLDKAIERQLFGMLCHMAVFSVPFVKASSTESALNSAVFVDLIDQ